MDVSEEGKQMWLCITQLPDDLLSLIYHKLNRDEETFSSDEESFSQTCHRFLDIAILSCRCLKVDVTTTSTNPLDSILLGRCLYRFSYYQFISMSFLDFYDTAITDNGLEMLTKYCNKFLINVSLRRCRHVTNTGICFLKQNCPQLRILKISGCDKVVGLRPGQGFSATLSFLEADSRALYPTGFLSGGGLKYLHVYNLTNLRKKRIGLAAIGSGIAKNLEVLKFEKGSFVTDHSIMIISKGCPLLKELTLESCSGIGLPGWVSIGLHCHNLWRLNVIDFKNLCDRGLLALGNGCKSLSVLYVKNYPKITSYGRRKFKIQRADVEIRETRDMKIFIPYSKYI